MHSWGATKAISKIKCTSFESQQGSSRLLTSTFDPLFENHDLKLDDLNSGHQCRLDHTHKNLVRQQCYCKIMRSRAEERLSLQQL